MKKIFTLILFCILTFNINAQRERNYIYLFDCTKSMEGFGGTPNIWNSTKKYLKEDVEKLNNEDNVYIIPFQGVVYKVIKFKVEELNWGKIESQLDNYIKNISKTNICLAWDEGIKYIDTNKDNYFFILTDGKDNIKGEDALCDHIRKWCGQFKNSYAFYVMLTPQARSSKLLDATKNCETISLIDANGGHIKPFARIDPNLLTVNTNELSKTMIISLSTNGNYSTKIFSSDPLFKVQLSSFNNGKAELRILAKKELHQIHQILNGVKEYKFSITIEGDNIKILNPNINIRVINIPEKTLEIKYKDEVNLGEASFYQKFLFWNEKKQDILEFNLSPTFNAIAKKAYSVTELGIYEINNSQQDFDVYFNGLLCDNNSFILNSKAEKALIGIKFHNNAISGKHYFVLKEIKTQNLDRINSDIPQKYQLSLRAKYDIYWNPLKTILLSLFCLILVSMMIFAFFYRLSNPKIKYNISIIDPINCAVVKKNEARKVILTNNQKFKQNVIQYIFKGQTKFIYNDFWLDNIELTAANHGVRLKKSKIYNCDPYASILKPNEDNEGVYSLIEIGGNQIIKLKIR
jgi:hypothetical protein